MQTALLAGFDALAQQVMTTIALPGVWFTGPEKVSIAAEARRATGAEPASGELPEAVEDATRTVAAAAHTIRRADIERWESAGLRVEAYVEIVSVVSRLAAIDVAAFGLGVDDTPLPPPVAGVASGELVPDAEISDGWVPTVGKAWPPVALSALPTGVEDMEAVHGALYLSMAEMLRNDIVRDDVTRAQMELAAARTSFLNDCFY